MLKTSAGVISPTGGLTNHLAKTCRELNKVCLLAVENSDILQEGETVELNSETGAVNKI